MDRRTAAALLLAGCLLCAPGAAAHAVDLGGGGTYLTSGKTYDFKLFNSGSTAWRTFYLVAPPGISFVGGTTANEGSANCPAGQPDGSSNEIECVQLSASVLPPRGAVAFVTTMTTEAACGPTFELFVNSADGATFTRLPDITEATGCGAASPMLIAPPKLRRIGNSVRATPPVWSPAAAHVRYRWERCDGSSCATIAGATGLALVLTKRDAGHAVVLVVTAVVAGEDVRTESRRWAEPDIAQTNLSWVRYP